MKIKICGIRRTEDADYLNELKPDYAGFVFAKSRRFVDCDKAAELRERLDPDIKCVGVFVNEDVGLIRKLVRDGVIDLVQLHGDEDDEYIRRLASPVPVIKAQRIRCASDVKKYASDYYLFDTYKGGSYGGTGETFDWAAIGKTDKPYFLAGGIDASNVRRAMEKKPYAIDVSSGVETDGFKDREKIEKIIREVRNYHE